MVNLVPWRACNTCHILKCTDSVPAVLPGNVEDEVFCLWRNLSNHIAVIFFNGFIAIFLIGGIYFWNNRSMLPRFYCIIKERPSVLFQIVPLGKIQQFVELHVGEVIEHFTHDIEQIGCCCGCGHCRIPSFRFFVLLTYQHRIIIAINYWFRNCKKI